jgi:hypothetical protein
MWSGFIWLSQGTRIGLSWTRQWKLSHSRKWWHIFFDWLNRHSLRHLNSSGRALLAACFLLVSRVAYSSTQKMEEIFSCETSGDFHRATRRYIPEDRALHNHRGDNLNSNYRYLISELTRLEMMVCLLLITPHNDAADGLCLTTSVRWSQK